MSEFVYRQRILDHFKNPRNYGKLKHPTHHAGHTNVSCGDAVQIQVSVAKGKIKDIAYTGTGCAISMAATSLLTDFVQGKSLAAIKKIGKKDIEQLLQIPITAGREKCAMMGLETLRQLQKISR